MAEVIMDCTDETVSNEAEQTEEEVIDDSKQQMSADKDTDTKETEQKDKHHKKGISITRALVLLGYDSWAALEPGK